MAKTPRAAAKPSSVPVDITDKLRKAGHLVGDDYNDDDRVYELDGVKVKVKTRWQTASLPTLTPHAGPDHIGVVEVVWITASVVGDNGKALRLDSGAAAVMPIPHQVTLQHDGGQPNLVVLIEKARFGAVAEAVRSWRTHQALKGITGLSRVAGV